MAKIGDRHLLKGACPQFSPFSELFFVTMKFVGNDSNINKMKYIHVYISQLI